MKMTYGEMLCIQFAQIREITDEVITDIEGTTDDRITDHGQALEVIKEAERLLALARETVNTSLKASTEAYELRVRTVETSRSMGEITWAGYGLGEKQK